MSEGGDGVRHGGRAAPFDLPLGGTWPCDREFAAHAARGGVWVPVVRRLLADEWTPVGLYRALTDETPGSFLLESAEVDGTWSRYSFVGVAPQATLLDDGGRARWIGQAPQAAPRTGGVLEVAAATLKALRQAQPSRLPTGMAPIATALVGLLGFDVVHEWERLPRRAADELALPDVHLVLPRELVVVDHRDSTIWLIASVFDAPTDAGAAAEARAGAVERLDAMQAALSRARTSPPTAPRRGEPAEPGARTERGEYLAQVERAQQAIRDGEVFQVVVGQRFDLPCPADALEVYRALRAANPSPYMYLLRCARPDSQPFAVVGSSPEALVRVEADTVTSHPIAGTRPRTGDARRDRVAAGELAADPKELAEHVMLVDLARNDVSKVCEAGSVQVTQYREVEYFSHVIHLVSTVVGRRRDGVGPIDVVRATFPAGTLSGAPKVRAIDLIDELEPVRRGVYGGCVGYLDASGDLDLAIAIRTAVIADERAYVFAGAGIVADSIPEAEWAECRAKAGAPLDAVARANGYGDVSHTPAEAE